MKKNRILSLILSAIMMFTVIFPAGVFAEENEGQASEMEVNEIVADFDVEEQPAAEQAVEVPAEDPEAAADKEQAPAAEEEEPAEAVSEEAAIEQIPEEPAEAAEDTEAEPEAAAEEEQAPATEEEESAEVVSEEATIEQIPEEPAEAAEAAEDASFSSGYVRVNAETIVYAADFKGEEIGIFTSSAVVYAVMHSRAANEAYSWLRITFHAADTEELQNGYVQFKDVAVLSDEAAEQLNESLKNDNTALAYGEKMLPAVSFKAAMKDAADVVVMGEDSEEVVEEPSYASAESITITSQPVSQTASVGEKVTMSVEATGSGLTYQWQYKKKTATTWSNSSGASAKTANWQLTVAAVHYTFDFQCVITDGSGNKVTTQSVNISDNAVFAITAQPADYEGGLGETATFTVAATGKGLTYQWQYRRPTGTTWTNTTLSGNKTDTLNVEVLAGRDGFLYQCVITDANGNTLTSDPAELRVLKFAITAQPADYEGGLGETATFTVAATGKGLTYQWQYRRPTGTTWTNTTLSGNKTDTLNVEVLAGRDGFLYQCVITDANGNTLTSDPAELRVIRPIIIDGVTYEAISATTCKVVSYSGSSSSLLIPETVEGMTVVEIGVEAFMGNTDLVSIDLPDTITIIRARAFKGCTSLSNMN